MKMQKPFHKERNRIENVKKLTLQLLISIIVNFFTIASLFYQFFLFRIRCAISHIYLVIKSSRDSTSLHLS